MTNKDNRPKSSIIEIIGVIIAAIGLMVTLERKGADLQTAPHADERPHRTPPRSTSPPDETTSVLAPTAGQEPLAKGDKLKVLPRQRQRRERFNWRWDDDPWND